MKKWYFLLVSIVLVLMGIWALIPGSALGTEPLWHAIAKIVIGIIGVPLALKIEG